MTLNVNSLLCHQCYACCDQTAEARITRFRYALYLWYLRIKFDNAIERKSLRISSIVYDHPASKVKLTSMLRCIYGQSLLLYTSAICIRPSIGLYTETAKAQTTLSAMGRQCGLYTFIYTSNYSNKNVLTVALTTHKAMSLRHKFDENIKGDSKLLITEATFGFCLLC